MSRSSSRKKRRARAKRHAKQLPAKVFKHLTTCPQRAREPSEHSWYMTNFTGTIGQDRSGVWHTCKTCGLDYLFDYSPSRCWIPGFGSFSEPVDALQLLALVGGGGGE